MYRAESPTQLESRHTEDSPGAWLSVDPTVWKLGFTSLLTDASAEMVQSILPLYFVLYLHFSPLQFGVLDGISQGGAVALLSLAAGVFADRRHRQKEVATAGYVVSAISRIALLAAGSAWTLIAGILALDRLGKGIRTAPRDAMISLSSRYDKLATSFAVHRALDAGGAVTGPLLAYLFLRMLPGTFDFVLVSSFCIAVVGVGVISLLVPKPSPLSAGTKLETPILQLCAGFWNMRRFRVLVIAGTLLGLATASDGFIYLLLRENAKASASAIPLYAFLTAVFYLLLSVPAGRLADRWGRRGVFLCGYALLPLIYGILLWPGVPGYMQYAVMGLFGAYYAATDGVLAAMTSAALRPELRTSGLAVLNTGTSVARLVSSVLFGTLWSIIAARTVVSVFLLGIIGAIVISGWIFFRWSENEAAG